MVEENTLFSIKWWLWHEQSTPKVNDEEKGREREEKRKKSRWNGSWEERGEKMGVKSLKGAFVWTKRKRGRKSSLLDWMRKKSFFSWETEKGRERKKRKEWGRMSQ